MLAKAIVNTALRVTPSKSSKLYHTNKIGIIQNQILNLTSHSISQDGHIKVTVKGIEGEWYLPSQDFSLVPEYQTPCVGKPLSSINHKVKLYQGTNFMQNPGTPVGSVEAGKVVKVGSHMAYGKYVEIQHGDKSVSIYTHLADIFVKEGQSVSSKQDIGKTAKDLILVQIQDPNGKIIDPKFKRLQ